jgi:hypothetical protein
LHDTAMISSPASQENMDSQSGALANLIELARLSRFTLLYHGAAVSAASGGEQAAALAGAAKSAAGLAQREVVVVFDAGSDLPVPDLLADIEAAVLEAAPDAPLAPPMAGPVEALTFWQQALGVRFLLIVQRFDRALSNPDPEFDDVLMKLAHDPLDISVLLLMDESAAPLLQRLKDALPELGETFLRLPEPSAPAPAPALVEETADADTDPAPRTAPAAASARFGPSPFLFDDPEDEPDDRPDAKATGLAEDLADAAPPAPLPPEAAPEAPPEERRRSRRFSTLLEQARIAPDTFDPPAEAAPAPIAPAPALAEDFTAVPVPAQVFPAAPALPVPDAAPLPIYPAAAPAYTAPELTLSDGRAEPSFQAVAPARPATAPGSTRVYRERRPMQVAAWMQKRRSRRRRGTMGMASRVGSSSTVLFVLMLMLAVLGWQMPQLGPSAGASPRAAAPQALAQSHQTMAVRGNRVRRSISATLSSAGTGRDTR